jgi:hypothetical protein
MHPRALGLSSLCFFLAASVVVTGCGNSHRLVCEPANESTCGCAACPLDAIPLLYATTSSNQILSFSISSSGSLTALPPTTGPANSQSVGSWFNSLVFGDASTNSVDSFAVGLGNGTLTPIEGSPFSLGTPDGGPTGLAENSMGFLYATEPNGTIVGVGTSSGLGSFGTPLPGSPYSAGVAPAEIVIPVTSTNLYASDPGDATGGILAFSIGTTGLLTPMSGSPFPTQANAGPSFVFPGAYSSLSGGSGAEFLFVSLSNAAKVAVFTINADGSLTTVAGSPFSVGNGPSTLAEDNSNHVFVMNALDHTVSAFNLASNGMLTPIGSPVSVGTATAGMAYYQNELFVADKAASEIWTLTIDGTTGALTQAGSPLPVSSAPLQLRFVDPLYPSYED